MLYADTEDTENVVSEVLYANTEDPVDTENVVSEVLYADTEDAVSEAGADHKGTRPLTCNRLRWCPRTATYYHARQLLFSGINSNLACGVGHNRLGVLWVA